LLVLPGQLLRFAKWPIVLPSSHTCEKPHVKSQVFFCFFGTKNFREQMPNTCKTPISDLLINTGCGPAKRKLALNEQGFVQVWN
jgi:hypothetical protein